MALLDTVPDLLAATVAAHPERTALLSRDRALSYRELGDEVDRLARGLAALGVGSGGRVALALPNCPEFVVGFLAIATLGGIVVPLSTHYQKQEVARYLADLEVGAILVGADLAPLYREVAPRREMPLVVVGGHDAGAGSLSFDAIGGKAEASGARRRVDPGWPVMLQFSSGSTGRSKRVARTQRNLAHEAEILSATAGLGPEDRILCVVPLFHTYGLGNCLLAPLRVGASTVILEKFHRQEVLEALAREAVTVFPAVPFMLGILADSASPKGLDLSSLRLCMSAGAPLPRAIFERFRAKYGVTIRQQYGSTETGCVAINLSPDPEPESVGPPIREVELRILGVEGSAEAPATGEVAVKSPAMADAYFENEALSRERFRDGYLLTGDLGWRDARGHLHLSGRSKIFINTATHKVDPSEVEELIRTHEKVAEVVVLGVPGSYGAELVKAVVVSKGACQESEILDHCKGKLAEYKIPRIVEFRDELPKSPLGKILKKYLQDPA